MLITVTPPHQPVNSIQWVAYAMTVFVNCDLVRHAVRRAGPWSRVSDEAVRTPMYALNLRRGYRPTGGLMYALNLRRGYRPTGGLEEPFFRAERVALYNLLMPVGDDFFLRSLLV